MIVLDTNVLVYAVGVEHPLRGPCRAIVDAAGDGHVAAATTAPILQEFLHVFGRRRSRAAAAAAARLYLDLLGPPLPLSDPAALVAIDLFERHPELDSGDALLAAVALGNPDVELLVTADRGFAAVPGLRVLDPRSPELAGMLA